jgi:hypothetical protein
MNFYAFISKFLGIRLLTYHAHHGIIKYIQIELLLGGFYEYADYIFMSCGYSKHTMS